MASRLWTFQRILPACEEGEVGAWKAFLDGYTSVAYELLGVYLPALRDRRKEIWGEALRTLAEDDYKRLRTFDHQAEREFLVDLRTFLMEVGAPRLDAARDVAGPPRPTTEALGTLLKDLPLLHREAMFMKLAGYSDLTLERMLGIPPALAARAIERLQGDFSPLLEREGDECRWPAAWLEFLRLVRGAGSKECAPLRQFVRIFDGQATWYDKRPIEEHGATCLHCLERWTSLREVIYWRAKAQPLSAAEADVFLSTLPIQSAPPVRKSLLGRLFG
jgi:hypothetical protein